MSCRPRTIKFVVPPLFRRGFVRIVTNSDEHSGWPELSVAIPPRLAISLATFWSMLLEVSWVVPFRRTIKSNGSPLIRNAWSSPSVSPNVSTVAQTTSPVPTTVINVVTQRTRRLRTLYLTGIIGAGLSHWRASGQGYTTRRRPSITDN